MLEPRPENVFLSYASDDRDLALRLANELRQAGIQVWVDTYELALGDDWRRAITNALQAASVVLVLVTPSSVESHWVTREWSLAIASSKLVIPVISGGTFSILKGPLADLQGVAYEPGDQASMQDLARRLTEATRRDRTDPSQRQYEQANALTEDPAFEEQLQRIVQSTVRQMLEPKLVTDGDVEPPSEFVFHITSFAPDMEPAAHAVKAAASAVGLTAQRVMDVPGDYRISDKIMEMIAGARMVVADLTHERPNVYFELGYARGLGKPVVTIIRDTAVAHFDVQDWTYIEYNDSRPLEKSLRDRFAYELGLPNQD